jgi:hypothetical protein
VAVVLPPSSLLDREVEDDPLPREISGEGLSWVGPLMDCFGGPDCGLVLGCASGFGSWATSAGKPGKLLLILFSVFSNLNSVLNSLLQVFLISSRWKLIKMVNSNMFWIRFLCVCINT